MSYGGSAHVSCQWGSAGSRWLLTEEGVWKALSEQQMERHICLQVPSACQQSRDKLWEDSGLNQVGDGWMELKNEVSLLCTQKSVSSLSLEIGSSGEFPSNIIEFCHFSKTLKVVVLLWSSHASGNETHLAFCFGGKTPYRDFFVPKGASKWKNHGERKFVRPRICLCNDTQR